MAEKVEFDFNVDKWLIKSKKLLIVQATVTKALVEWGAQELHRTTVANVSGDRYGFKKGSRGGRTPIRGVRTNAGTLPVPVVYGFLRKSIKNVKISTVLRAIWQDPKVAHYGKFVHDGTKKMAPRRFLHDAVRNRKAEIMNMWEIIMIKEIRRVGRKVG